MLRLAWLGLPPCLTKFCQVLDHGADEDSFERPNSLSRDVSCLLLRFEVDGFEVDFDSGEMLAKKGATRANNYHFLLLFSCNMHFSRL